MSKPDNLGAWATDPLAVSEPPEDVKVSGFLANQQPPPKWHNWLWNISYVWHKYTDNLHNELEFLNKNYAWSGNHTHDPAGPGVLRVGGTNNLAQLRSHTGIQLVNGLPWSEVRYTDETGAPVGRPRKKMVRIEDPDFTSRNKRLVLDLPHGATLTSMRAWITKDSASDTTAFVYFKKSVRSGVSGLTVIDLAPEFSIVGAGGSGLADSGALNEPIDNETTTYYFEYGSTTGSDPILSVIYWAEVEFLDPGPTNR